MLHNYPPLRFMSLNPQSDIRIVSVIQPPRVVLDSSALAVLTDFTHIPAATIEPEALVNYANDLMRWRSVRTFLVTEAGGKVAGILTATDVLGEKPLKFAIDNRVRHNEVRVLDIMTPRALFEFLDYEEVRSASVGHVVATLRHAGRQHIMVGARTQAGECIRGIFSLSQIARQLGVDLQPSNVAQSFSEIEAALSH